MSAYYCMDNRRFTLSECWRMGEGLKPAFFMLLAWKAVRKQIDFQGGTAFPFRIEENLIDPDRLPERAREVLAAPVYEFRKMGFSLVHHVTLRKTLHPAFTVCADLVNESREIVARVNYILTVTPTATSEMCSLGLVSRLQDDSIWSTDNSRPVLKQPPWSRGAFQVGAFPRDLLELHQKGLAKHRRLNSPVPVADVGVFLAEYEDRSARFNIDRGVYAPMNEEQVEQARDYREKWLPEEFKDL